jgi:hypothetical protein
MYIHAHAQGPGSQNTKPCFFFFSCGVALLFVWGTQNEVPRERDRERGGGRGGGALQFISKKFVLSKVFFLDGVRALTRSTQGKFGDRAQGERRGDLF